jgi:hypothetical protein
MEEIIKASLSKSLTYFEYRKLVTDLLLEGKSTGPIQTDDLLHYSKLNETRMNRLEKTIVISPENTERINLLRRKYIWLVISEGWCGDAAQLLPIMHKMEVLSDNIDFKIVLRDENPALMDKFLTNGGRSIPKLIVLDKETLEVLADWGPRPKEAFDLIKNYKEEHGVIDEKIKTELQMWYLHDKGLSTQNELIELMRLLEIQE